jgi:hypothetical protein
MRPAAGDCVIYSDFYCAQPILGFEGFQNPGNGNLPGNNVGSFLCSDPIVYSVGSGTVSRPSAHTCDEADKAQLKACTQANYGGTCENVQWQTFACQALDGTL